MLFINKSKIQFKVKSQLKKENISIFIRCLSISQRYNSKSNHNFFDGRKNPQGVVYQ